LSDPSLVAANDAADRYSALFGTFLHNCERERLEANTKAETQSLWDMIVVDSNEYKNPLFSPIMHPNGLAFVPSMSKLQLWKGYYLRQVLRTHTLACVVLAAGSRGWAA